MWADDAPTWPVPRVIANNPFCKECGCSVVSRFGGKPTDTCWSCEDAAIRMEQAVGWGDAA